MDPMSMSISVACRTHARKDQTKQRKEAEDVGKGTNGDARKLGKTSSGGSDDSEGHALVEDKSELVLALELDLK